MCPYSLPKPLRPFELCFKALTPLSCAAEATMQSQSRMALAVRRQCGPQACEVSSKLANAAAGSNATRGGHRVLRKVGLAERIPKRIIVFKNHRIPTLALQDFCNHMVKRHKLSILIGERSLQETYDMLKECWETFLKIFPMHNMAKRIADGTIDPSRAIPMYTHIDEGRGC